MGFWFVGLGLDSHPGHPLYLYLQDLIISTDFLNYSFSLESVEVICRFEIKCYWIQFFFQFQFQFFFQNFSTMFELSETSFKFCFTRNEGTGTIGSDSLLFFKVEAGFVELICLCHSNSYRNLSFIKVNFLQYRFSFY